VTLVWAITDGRYGCVVREGLPAQPVSLRYEPGIWGGLVAVQNGLALALAVFLLIGVNLKRAQPARSQSMVLSFGVLIPCGAYALSLLSSANGIRTDWTPPGLFLGAMWVGAALFGKGLFKPHSWAYDLSLLYMHQAVLLLDHETRLLDCNPAAERLLGVSHKSFGQPLSVAFAGWPEFRVDGVLADAFRSRTIAKQEQLFDIESIPLTPAHPVQNGWLVVITDSTTRRQAESRLRQLSQAVEQSPTSVIITDTSGRITYVNPKFCAITGYTPEEVLGKNPSLLKSGDTAAEEYRTLWETIRAGQEWHGEFHNRKKNGELYWELAVIAPVLDENGQVTHYIAVKEDITARKNAEAAEREQRQFAEALTDTASMINRTLLLDEVLDRILQNVGRVVPHDDSLIALLNDTDDQGPMVRGFTKAGNKDRRNPFLSLPANEYDAWRRMLQTGEAVVIPDTTQDGRWIETALVEWVRSYVAAPLVVKKIVIGFLDLSSATPGFFNPTHAQRLKAFADAAAIAIENARLYADVERLSIVDELTGIYNFRGLRLMGPHEFEHARRFNRKLAVLFADIDHFREFNNRYSHAVGNLVLQAVARRARGSVRGVDVMGRFGGEEFVVLLPEADLKMAYHVAERLRQDVAHHEVETDQGRLSVTLSIGVAELTPDMPNIDALIDLANAAEHQAKARGRNRVETLQSLV